MHSSQPGSYTLFFCLATCQQHGTGSGVALRLGQGELRQQGLQLRLSGAAHRGALLQHAARKAIRADCSPSFSATGRTSRDQLAACLFHNLQGRRRRLFGGPTSGASAATSRLPKPGA